MVVVVAVVSSARGCWGLRGWTGPFFASLMGSGDAGVTNVRRKIEDNGNVKRR